MKSERATPCVCAILCALVDNLLEQNWGLLMIFLKDFPQNPPINGKVGRGPRDLWESGIKISKNSPLAKFWRKKTQLFWDVIIFTLKSWKCIFFKKLMLSLPLFIHCKNCFSKNLFFDYSDEMRYLNVCRVSPKEWADEGGASCPKMLN